MGSRPRKGGYRMEGLHMMIRMVLMVALLSAPFPQPGLASDIPRAAERHRAELIRVSRAVWGLEAPVAVFAAQVHTESWWRNGTVSPAGAQGLAQFLPSTAEWLPRAVPELEREAGRPAPFNPGWALRALVSYDKWLWDRLGGADACQRMAFALSAYNGGIGWVGRRRSGRAVIRRAGSGRWKRRMPGGALPASAKTAAMCG